MAGKFWYPTHWADIARDAFVQAPTDHDSHGFGADFVAQQEDRDRALEDYLNTLPASGGIQGDRIDIDGSVSVPTGAVYTQMLWTFVEDHIGSSITIAAAPSNNIVTINQPGAYLYHAAIEYPAAASIYLAETGLSSSSSFGGPWYYAKTRVTPSDTGGHVLAQSCVFSAADVAAGAYIQIQCRQNSGGPLTVTGNLGVQRLS